MDINIRTTESPQSELDHTVGSWFLGELETFFQEELKDEYGIDKILAKTTKIEHFQMLEPETKTSINVTVQPNGRKANSGLLEGEVEAAFFDIESDEFVARITVDVEMEHNP